MYYLSYFRKGFDSKGHAIAFGEEGFFYVLCSDVLEILTV